MTEQMSGTDVEFPVRDLVRQVTEELAPEESRVLAALEEFDDAEALRRLTAKPGRDERLGFGLAEAIALSSAVAWIGVDQAVRRIVDATADEAARTRRRWWPFSRRRKAAPATVVPVLNTEQLRLVDCCVLEAAKAAGLSKARGRIIADGVVRRLVTGPGTSPAIGSPDTP